MPQRCRFFQEHTKASGFSFYINILFPSLKKSLSFFLVFFLVGHVTGQQQYKVRLGASFHTACKIVPGNHLNWLATLEPALQISISGQDPNQLGFMGSIGLLVDPIKYKVQAGSNFSITQNNIVFTGLINFPTKNESISILGGIGIELCAEPILSYSLSAEHQNQNSLYVDLDSGARTINEYRKKVLPSISLGISYKPFRNNRLMTYCSFKQNLIYLFTEDISIPYTLNRQQNVATLNYRPTYLKVGLSWDFWK